jgi:hypothetical protein
MIYFSYQDFKVEIINDPIFGQNAVDNKTVVEILVAKLDIQTDCL